MSFSVEQRCKLWLSTAEVTTDQLQPLTCQCESAAGVWEAFAKDKERMFPQAQVVSLERMHNEKEIDDYVNRLEKLKITVLFEESEDYPALLREIDDPPYVLYCVGHLSALQKPLISVIGTRRPSAYGKQMGRQIARGLAEAGVCVVSGLAYGIDACAHEGALEGKGATVAVLGSGVNTPYPQENIPLLRSIIKGGGLAMSEFPLDAKPLPGHFPYRNRVISGLSQALVFVEGKIKSGGMITVASALAQGREVFAVPGQAGTTGAEGPHTILREGARLATSARDILEDLGLLEEPSVISMAAQPGTETEGMETSTSPVQRMILEALKRESMTMDQLIIATGSRAEDLMPELSVMEIMGQVRKDAGNLFSMVF